MGEHVFPISLFPQFISRIGYVYMYMITHTHTEHSKMFLLNVFVYISYVFLTHFFNRYLKLSRKSKADLRTYYLLHTRIHLIMKVTFSSFKWDNSFTQSGEDILSWKAANWFCQRILSPQSLEISHIEIVVSWVRTMMTLLKKMLSMIGQIWNISSCLQIVLLIYLPWV